MTMQTKNPASRDDLIARYGYADTAAREAIEDLLDRVTDDENIKRKDLHTFWQVIHQWSGEILTQVDAATADAIN